MVFKNGKTTYLIVGPGRSVALTAEMLADLQASYAAAVERLVIIEDTHDGWLHAFPVGGPSTPTILNGGGA